MGMVCPQTRVAEAEVAEDGTLSAGEFCADVGGSFLAVEEAGDNSGCEWAIVDHIDYNYQQNNSKCLI